MVRPKRNKTPHHYHLTIHDPDLREQSRWGPSKKPTFKQMALIRRVLKMARNETFPPCPGKSNDRVKKYEEAGDFSHSDKDHICAECRCRRVAGYGTYGNFYGDGTEDVPLGEAVGHYGSGYCYFHEQGRNYKKAEKFAVKEIQRQKQMGFMYRTRGNLLDKVRQEAELAYNRTQLVGEIDLIRSKLQELLSMLDDDRPAIIEKKIDELREAIKGVEFVDGEQADDLMQKLDILELFAGPTESSKAGPVPMTDKTKIDLETKMALAIAKLATSQLKVDSSRMIDVDEITPRVYKTLQLVEKMVDKEQFKEFTQRYMEMWQVYFVDLT